MRIYSFLSVQVSGQWFLGQAWSSPSIWKDVQQKGLSFHILELRQLESQPLDSSSLEKWLFMAPCARSLPTGQHFPLCLTHKQSWKRSAVRPKMESPDELNRLFYIDTSNQIQTPPSLHSNKNIMSWPNFCHTCSSGITETSLIRWIPPWQAGRHAV